MVDVDGSKRYSKVISIAFDAKNKAFSVYPNPANTSTITLDATLDNDSYLTFEWFDIAGRSRLVSQQKANQGANQIQVDVSALEKGVYFITTRKAASNEILQTMRFIKQ